MRQPRQLIVEIRWPPEGRADGPGHTYLVLAGTKKRAVARVEARWAGKQGGASPHTTEVVDETDIDLFQIVRRTDGTVS